MWRISRILSKYTTINCSLIAIFQLLETLLNSNIPCKFLQCIGKLYLYFIQFFWDYIHHTSTGRNIVLPKTFHSPDRSSKRHHVQLYRYRSTDRFWLFHSAQRPNKCSNKQMQKSTKNSPNKNYQTQIFENTANRSNTPKRGG